MRASHDSLSRTFAALADPTRRATLARLAKGPATVAELAAPFDISGPAVSKHLRVLERARLIARGRQAQCVNQSAAEKRPTPLAPYLASTHAVPRPLSYHLENVPSSQAHVRPCAPR
jgi:hypothetical protein